MALYIVDSFKSGKEHEIINGMLVKMYADIYDEIRLRTLSSHFSNIQKYFHKKNIQYKSIYDFRNGDSKILILLQYFFGFLYDIYYYICAKEVLFLTINPLSLFIIKLTNIFLNKKVIFVCHGELDSLRKNGLKYFSKYYRPILVMLKISFNIKINKNIYYLILGESIKKNLLSINSYYSKLNLIVIDHPYEYENQSRYNEEKNEVITFGSIGIATKEKNSDKIFELANKFDSEVSLKQLKFILCGKIKFDIDCYDTKNVTMPVKYNNMLERSEYEKIINQIDYVLFFYKKDSYKLIASGAFFDVLKMEKPIISIKNDFFQYYFDKYGEIGYLCEDVEQMEQVINNIIYYKEDKKDLFIKNIKKIKEELSYEKIKNKLLEQMEKI